MLNKIRNSFSISQKHKLILKQLQTNISSPRVWNINCALTRLKRRRRETKLQHEPTINKWKKSSCSHRSGLGTAWRCLDPHILHILSFVWNIPSMQLVDCDSVVLLVFMQHLLHVCLSVCLSREGSLFCGSSWSFFHHFFFTLLKVFFCH